jgi:cephalosporin-C deacetylase-like acetyl esterase
MYIREKFDNLILLIALVFGMITHSVVALNETLPLLKEGEAPQDFEQMWDGFDPRAEPLDTEILKQWDEDGVVMQVIRYRIGIFKGQKAMMAAVYGYPEAGTKLPGLVQIHGGGQYADYRAVLTNAKRGYATISIAWAGRINAPDYNVNPDTVKLFWEGKVDDPGYKLTTDWGALDGYHAPCRNQKNSFSRTEPESWTLDPVESPRNNPWFLCTLGARRALTFLEKQPQVDPDKLGVYGHSMGGKITVLTTAADYRVKASAPSCGGLSDRNTGKVLYDATLADDVSLKRIACPIIFLSPSNDFHGRIDDLQKALHEIKSRDWRVTCSPHHNHQDTQRYQAAGLLWFDQYLKGSFTYPETPKSSLTLNTESHIPSFTVKPDMSSPVLSVEIYYTQQGNMDGVKDDRENVMNRFWHYAEAKRTGSAWTADLPLMSLEKPLWVYANVVYSIDKPVTGAGYYYEVYTAHSVNISSVMHIASPGQLKESSVQATMKPSLLIENFKGDWEKEWFTYKPQEWGRSTHKIHDDKWKAPQNAKLAFAVQSYEPNKLVVGIDTYACEIQLAGGSGWQQIVLSPDDFHDASGEVLKDWEGIMEFRFGAKDRLQGKVDGKDKALELGADWNGSEPDFRNLRWVGALANKDTLAGSNGSK